MFQSTFLFTLNSSGLIFYKPISIAFKKAVPLALNLGKYSASSAFGAFAGLYPAYSPIPAVRIAPRTRYYHFEAPIYRGFVALLQNHTRALAF